MQTPTTVKLDGHSYTIQYLSTSQAIETATEVGAALMPALGKVIPAGSLTDALSGAASLDLGAGLEVLAKEMQPTKLLNLIKVLCSVVILDGKGLLADALFEDHFRGRPGAALKLAAKSYEVSCGDFFGSAVSLVGLTKRAASTPDQAG